MFVHAWPSPAARPRAANTGVAPARAASSAIRRSASTGRMRLHRHQRCSPQQDWPSRRCSASAARGRARIQCRRGRRRRRAWPSISPSKTQCHRQTACGPAASRDTRHTAAAVGVFRRSGRGARPRAQAGCSMPRWCRTERQARERAAPPSACAAAPGQASRCGRSRCGASTTAGGRDAATATWGNCARSRGWASLDHHALVEREPRAAAPHDLIARSNRRHAKSVGEAKPDRPSTSPTRSSARSRSSAGTRARPARNRPTRRGSPRGRPFRWREGMSASSTKGGTM